MQKDRAKSDNKITKHDRFILCFFLISSFLISLPLLNDFPINTDEGIILHGATRIINGEVPYRDFWHITLPGAIWLYALVFKIAGENFIVARLFGYLVIAGQCILLYLIGRKITTKPLIPVLASITFFLHIIICEVNCEPQIIAVFFVLLALWIILSYKSTPAYVLAGIAIGLSISTQQNIGAAGLVGLLLAPLFLMLKEKISYKDYLMKSFLIISGIIVIFTSLLFYLIYTDSLNEAIFALFHWPFTNYTRFNKYPFLYSELISIKEWVIKNGFSMYYLIDISPLIIFLSLPVIYIFNLVFAILSRNQHTLIVVCYAIMLFLSVALLRPDYPHLLFVSPLSFFLFFYSVSLLWHNWKEFRVKIILRGLSIILVFIIGLSLIRGTLLYKSMATNPELPLETTRGRVSITYHTPSWMYEVIRYIESSTEENEPIFIYHWSPVLYFLTGRKNPTPFDTYKPIYNTDEQMQKIIDSLKKYRPRLIVKDRYIDSNPWNPNRNIFPNVDWTTLLDKDKVNNFIQKNYLFKGYIGGFKIFQLPEDEGRN